MKLNFNIPLGVSCYGTPFKRDPFSGLFSFIDSRIKRGENERAMKMQHKFNMEEMDHSQMLNKDYQNFLYNTQYGAAVQGMRGAGINPAGASTSIAGMSGGNGLSIGGTTAQPSPGAGLDKLDILGSIETLKQLKEGSKQAKEKTTQDQMKTESDKIDLENKKAGQEEYNTEKYYTDPDTGEKIEPDQLDAWMKSHPGTTPDLQVIKTKGGKGKMEAQRSKEEFKTSIREFKQRVDDADTRHALNKLERMVANGKMDNQKVMDALVTMPVAEKRRINAMADQLEADKDLIKVKKELEEKRKADFDYTSVQGVMDKINDKDASFFEKFLAVLIWIVNKRA